MYTAEVGNIQMLTMERAMEVFQTSVALCCERNCVLSDISDDMHRMRFSWIEIEG